MIWVLDASVALCWLIRGEQHPAADAVLRALIDRPAAFTVPELFLFETFAVLCRQHPNPGSVFRQGILPLVEAGVFRQPMTERLAALAAPYVALGLSGHDAAYAALAEEVHGLWLTVDDRAHGLIASRGVSHGLGAGLPAGLG